MFAGRVYVSVSLPRKVLRNRDIFLVDCKPGRLQVGAGVSFPRRCFSSSPPFLIQVPPGEWGHHGSEVSSLVATAGPGAAAGAGPAFPGQGICSRQVWAAAHGPQPVLCQQLQLLQPDDAEPETDPRSVQAGEHLCARVPGRCPGCVLPEKCHLQEWAVQLLPEQLRYAYHRLPREWQLQVPQLCLQDHPGGETHHCGLRGKPLCASPLRCFSVGLHLRPEQQDAPLHHKGICLSPCFLALGAIAEAS